MSNEASGRMACRHAPCSYGDSLLQFRGPAAWLEGDYLAFLGGTETVGPYLPRPFAKLVGNELDIEAVNLGIKNVGPDAFLGDRTTLGIASRACACVIELGGAMNISNRFYAVHPRRNDRFVRAHDDLLCLFPDLDLTEVHFTGHLMCSLAAHDAEAFEVVVEELKAAWTARMEMLVAWIDAPVLLLWFGEAAIPDEAQCLGRDPWFIDRAMVDALHPLAREVIEIAVSEEARADGPSEMIFPALAAPAAAAMLSARSHREAAQRLAPALARYLPGADGTRALFGT
ncbi:MAG: DUF6473 family protein [Shimia sp.]